MRQLLSRALNNDDGDLESDLSATEDSFGALRDAESPDRRPSEREKHLDRMWHHTS